MLEHLPTCLHLGFATQHSAPVPPQPRIVHLQPQFTAPSDAQSECHLSRRLVCFHVMSGSPGFYMSTDRSTVVAELSWDAFPPPPPEAENWVPDPDSIARPGTLKDPRLHKDPYAEQKKSAMKREMRFQSTSRGDSISSASGSSAPAVRAPLGAWPAQAVRSSGSYLEIIVPPRKKHTTESPTIIAQTMPQTIPQISFQPSVKSVALPHTIIPAWAGPLEKVCFSGIIVWNLQQSTPCLRVAQRPPGQYSY
jgi:hypothetical protein